MEKANLFIVTAPSGAGKTTLLKRLLRDIDNLIFSVSYTTRPPRDGERHGRDYFFSTVKEFKELRDRGEFLEWAEVHGNYYATSRSFVMSHIKKGIDVVLDIDVAGAEQVRQKMKDALSIFIVPPSLEALRERLVNRNKDTTEVIERRLTNASSELKMARDFNFILVNDDLDRCYANLKSVFLVSRLKKEQTVRKIQRMIENYS
ncbi:MAG: guanylate kinase [Acidobacteria bacterium]|nr:MAG: guanylate kinase [Acidobacteriota bacterium]